MCKKNLAWIITLCIGVSFTCLSHAEECFHVALPENTTSISVPAIRFGAAAKGATTNPPGFYLFHSGENLALNGPACFYMEQDINRYVTP